MGFSRVFFVLLLTVSSVLSAPPRNISNVELEKKLSNFLDTYYEKYVKDVKFEDLNSQKRKSERKIDSKDDLLERGNVYDKMQSDQPEENDNNVNIFPPFNNFTGNLSDVSILQASRDRKSVGDDENR
ncbi:hypothetical protein WA026_011161 [Henosepilachna vigintioctopunctata]|uniref:Uncharacterized protein n=1 Tax=Henosepilachna vigintioctopunctata TaxID=420089 RepID=A0AAW1U639_9CUCU